MGRYSKGISPRIEPDAVLRRNKVEGEKWGLYGDVYIVRGKEKDGISTDSIIADIEDGTLFEVSIGFELQ